MKTVHMLLTSGPLKILEKRTDVDVKTLGKYCK